MDTNCFSSKGFRCVMQNPVALRASGRRQKLSRVVSDASQKRRGAAPLLRSVANQQNFRRRPLVALTPPNTSCVPPPSAARA